MEGTSIQMSTKSGLQVSIDTAWGELQASINRFTPDQLTGLRDSGGWAAKDHIAHMAAWENSMVFLLQGHPRHEGLGVQESTYLAGDEDETNDEIFRKTCGLELTGALALHSIVHKKMLALLENLDEPDLQRTYSHYLSNEPGTDDGSPIIDRILGNTAHHYDLHRTYIERLVCT